MNTEKKNVPEPIKDEDPFNYTAGCGLKLHISHCEEDDKILIRVGKGGSCNHQIWEVIAEMVSILPRKKVVEIFEHRHCEKGFVGNQSCFAKVPTYLKRIGEIKETKAKESK